MRALCLVSMLLASCTKSPADTFDRGAMLRSLGETVIVPSYEAFEERAEALASATEAFCESPSTQTLDELDAAFRAAKSAFKQTESFALGPHTDAPLRLGPKVDSWPVMEAQVDEVLLSEDAVDAEALELQGARKKGFAAFSYLLFSPDDSVTAFEDERRCAYLQGMAGNLAARAGDYVEAWSPTGADHVGDLAEGRDPYTSVQAAASLVFDQLVFTIENVRELKIGKPQGKRDMGALQLEFLEDRYGHTSLQDAIDALKSAQAIYLGRFGDNDGVGIQDWLRSRRPALDDAVQEALSAALAALEAIKPDTLEEALQSRPEDVEEAYQAIKDMQVLMTVDVAGALGVTVTFNPTDGD